MEDDGIDIAKLEEAIEQNPNTRLLYLIPNFQNPTGITMSLEKRRAVYEIAKKNSIMILEDNPYGDLRFAGESLPTIKSLDKDGIVFYAGTFSKILSTGIRVGYLVAPKGIIGKIVVAKQCTDVHTNMLGQLLCYSFLTECDIDAHLERNKIIYAEKCGLMLSEMEKHFPAGIKWTKPNGGLFIWVTLPEGTDATAFATELVRDHKVCVVPGSAFGVASGDHTNCFRLNFSTPLPENIIKGIGIIAEQLKLIV